MYAIDTCILRSKYDFVYLFSHISHLIHDPVYSEECVQCVCARRAPPTTRNVMDLLDELEDNFIEEANKRKIFAKWKTVCCLQRTQFFWSCRAHSIVYLSFGRRKKCQKCMKNSFSLRFRRHRMRCSTYEFETAVRTYIQHTNWKTAHTHTSNIRIERR